MEVVPLDVYDTNKFADTGSVGLADGVLVGVMDGVLVGVGVADTGVYVVNALTE